MATRPLPSPEVVRQLLTYDAETGKLTWLYRDPKWFTLTENWSAEWQANTWNKQFAGKEAFTPINSSGYHTGTIFRKMLQAHRVAWAIAYGRWPDHFLDHINGIRTDNRLINLREATRSQNARNSSKSMGSSGVRGVRAEGPRWTARLAVNGRTRSVGTFDTIEEAAAAYQNAVAIHYGEFAANA